MMPFDKSKITYGIYRAKALVVGDFVTDVLKSMERPHLQRLRFYEEKEYAITPRSFIHKIASHTLLPNTPEEKIDDIVSSDFFNVSTTIKSVNNNRKRVSVVLSSPGIQSIESLAEFPNQGEYVGLSSSLFKDKKFSFLENLAVYVDPGDVIYWKKYEDSLKELKQNGNSLDLEDVVRRPGFEPGF